jgi:tRNA pseudouridine55 synthase
MNWTDYPVFTKDNFLKDFLNEQPDAGILLVHKPVDWTSFDVVKFTRSRINRKKIGHAGTLDPMAEGLLVLCFGKATKTIDQIQSQEKEYVARIQFGSSTLSYDAETDIDEQAPYDHVDRQSIESCLHEKFHGDIAQVPPMYSALKRDGKKLYELARKGKTIEREARQITIYSTDIHSYEEGVLEMKVTCSKGTYIRSLAHDLGEALGTKAHLSGLIRTKIGTFSTSDAISIDVIKSLNRFQDD